MFSETHEDKDIKRRGLLLILSAPSGTGKTTLMERILQEDKHIHPSISVTTRSIRSGEKDGVNYYYTDVATFKQMVQESKLLEHAEIFGHLYGTPKFTVEKYLNAGEDVIFDIDWQGHTQLRAISEKDVASVFILPPSKEDLLKRIRLRNQDDEKVIKERLTLANLDINHWHEYDYVIINRNIQESVRKLMSILHSERLKKTRRTGLPVFVDNLLQQDIEHLL
ncbi:Guanylate kinase [Alphaproteobacteria bacterium]